MPDVTISYKGNSIATMSASGTKTLLTEGKYCEDDITVAYTKPSAPTPTYQAKTNITPTTSSQTITADAGYDALSSVQINAMPSGSASTPATTITANPTITVSSGGLITATASASKSVTPTVSAGYVSAGTAGTVSVSGSNTSQLTAKAAATYTPTTADQTIASGQYLTGAQTIKGDANLLAENIKDGVTIFGVTGTYTGGGGGTYTVTVTLTNPRHSPHFTSFGIYEQHSDSYYDIGEAIGQISSPTGSTQVSVSSSIYGVGMIVSGTSVADGTVNCTGGVSFTDTDYAGVFWFEVVGDGTITIDGIDYDS